MSKTLTNEDIDEKSRGKLYIQDYSARPTIDGVKIIPIKNFVGEDGDFSEIIRLDNGKIEGIEDMNVAQVNRSRLLPGAIKGWHLHFEQEDIFYLPPSDSLLVGLWDLRRESSTNGVSMKITLGAGQSSLLYIPRGVAHGMVNLSGEPIDLFYFVSGQFNAEHPDERRVPWDSLGEDFWTPKKD
ncbi:MAG TPA: dTDP-4-dehydrorhamnose 3,5-epimerase family protein [Patescibacteria group bacterium]|nr:dTDP-4-dehydrorhamnose 3,5-epimerase family protein [Patescibacteria group bacterium]